MRLEYKILWFENDKPSFVARQRLVKRVVEKLGFYFPEPKMEVDSSNIENLDFKSYDLIIADLNLDNNEKGSVILDAIRKKEIYTEAVFYSSEGEDYVRNELSKYKIEGAYCANRDVDDFIDKVEKVIHTTVKKVQDLNNMRGLIMAETSDIDNSMFEIIATVLEQDSFGIKEGLTAAIFANVRTKVNSKKDYFDKYQSNGRIDKVINDNLMFDTFQKILAIQFIIDSINHDITMPHKKDKFRESYTELKQKRDLLAHVIEVHEEGKMKLKSGNRELEFTDEFCIDIRIQVKQHGKNLEEILNLILK